MKVVCELELILTKELPITKNGGQCSPSSSRPSSKAVQYFQELLKTGYILKARSFPKGLRGFSCSLAWGRRTLSIIGNPFVCGGFFLRQMFLTQGLPVICLAFEVFRLPISAFRKNRYGACCILFSSVGNTHIVNCYYSLIKLS